ncbi:LAMI_0G05600g1_1 [Lachancea mirantina]|uniref:LAMI_0G05600g1_1 n=1 Tax=Lachancea mirantina TaxID=1230905 RepID=A0A1G4K8W4_9SACH|nr:LAMI_0G05600g1_1 [Lachancea mirantina]
MSDPRRRSTRHLLTPDNLSSAIQITNLPQNWTQETVTSVIAGSGPIVAVSTRTDPRNGKIIGVIVEYATSKDCKRALETIQKIKKFPCDMERTIPAGYRDSTKNQRSVLDLQREKFPWESGLELPFELVSEVPLPRRPTNPVPVSGGDDSSTSPTTAAVAFPDILSKASQHLPALRPNAMATPDSVSINLSKIAPLQLLEMISNLKILANQDAQRSQLENFLGSNVDVSIAVTQALLEMGFINYPVVTKVLTEQQTVKNSPQVSTDSAPLYSNGNTPNATPVPTGNVPLNSFSGPAPVVDNLQQQQQPQQPFNYPQPAAPQAPVIPPMSAPIMGSQPQLNYAKLSTLPQQQQDMIKQVITLPMDQISLLPPEQVAMVDNFKKEYLL